MRVERHGGPPDLQAAFKAFVLHALKGRALDDNQDREAAEGQFPDFGCFRDLLLVEMKHLESDQEGRINGVVDQKLDPEEKPVFFGKRDGDLVLNSASNAEQIKAAVASKLSRTIEKILHKADKQFGDYRERHPRKNSVSICVLLNSQLQEFSPDLVMYSVHSKITKSGRPNRFPNIDVVLYISEKHFRILPDGRIAFAIVNFLCAGAVASPWKAQFVDLILKRWSQFRTGDDAVAIKSSRDFETVEDIPRIMKRHEIWTLEYRRNPYMRKLSDAELKVAFNRCVAQSSVAFVKGDWQAPPREETMRQMRLMSHLIEETNRRGIDIRSFSPGLLPPEDRAEILRGLPAELVDMFSKAMQAPPNSGQQ